MKLGEFFRLTSTPYSGIPTGELVRGYEKRIVVELSTTMEAFEE